MCSAAVADRPPVMNFEQTCRQETTGAMQANVSLPKPHTSNAKSEGRFGKPDLVHLPEKDV